MARSEQLTALSVKALSEPGRYLDQRRENGLLLQVQKGRSGTLSKGWVVRFSAGGRRREMGLGRFPEVSLASARAAAEDARRAAAEGRDPIAERRAAQAVVQHQAAGAVAQADAAAGEARKVRRQDGAQAEQAGPVDKARAGSADSATGEEGRLDAGTSVGACTAAARPVPLPAAPDTFRGCAEAYLAAHAPSWRNPKHRQQWENTLRTYAYPVIGDLHASDVTLDHVLAIIEPIWTQKTETASRLRGRIQAVLSYAIMRGYRAPPNPATWRGQLEVLLPQKAKVAPVRHHAALPYAELPSFYARLTERSAPGALALRFLILTAARSNEVRGMRWGEVDWDAGVWTVPAARMKVGTEHRVPLSGPAVTLLREQAVLQVAGPGRDAVGEEALGEKAINEAATSTDPAPAALVFPNASGTGPMSDGVWRALFRRMGCPEITAHGFRSTFRDSCGEETTHPRELAEHALAHEVGNAVERAYRRGDALERRRRVVQDWGAFVTGG